MTLPCEQFVEDSSCIWDTCDRCDAPHSHHELAAAIRAEQADALAALNYQATALTERVRLQGLDLVAASEALAAKDREIADLRESQRQYHRDLMHQYDQGHVVLTKIAQINSNLRAQVSTLTARVQALDHAVAEAIDAVEGVRDYPSTRRANDAIAQLRALLTQEPT